MIKKHILTVITLMMLHSIINTPVYGSVIVQAKIQQGPDVVNDTNAIYMKLFDKLTPLTVTNFLNYVNDGDYVDSIFHRSVPDFVIQGGGYTYDSPNTVLEISRDPAVVNEYFKSNTVGTIAMAKGATPDSATSEWFFNLADNSANLDLQNDGFTVFGEVIADGLSIVNLMAEVPNSFHFFDFSAFFDNLPLIDHIDGDDVTDNNLIVLRTIEQMFSITTDFGLSVIIGKSTGSEDVDFGKLIVGNTITSTVTIKNESTELLEIGDVANIDTLLAPFQMNSENCSDSSLMQNQTCTLEVQFTAIEEGVFTDTLNIEFTNLALSYSLNVHGDALVNAEPNIVLSTELLDFKEVELYDFSAIPAPPPVSLAIQITNDGILDLNVSDFILAGTFKENELQLLSSDCENTNDPLTSDIIEPDITCRVFLGVFPLEPIADINATLTIISDDPDQPSIVIPITAIVIADNDNVPAAIENLAPNQGDGNNDDILDSLQSHVISIADENNNYTTIETNEGVRFLDFTILDSNLLINPPGGNLLGSVYQFKQPAISGSAEFGIILPANLNIEKFYMYGGTFNNTDPHWYEFPQYIDALQFGYQTGVNVNLKSPSGEIINRTVIKITLRDGLYGDSDLSGNGEVSFEGTYLVSTKPHVTSVSSFDLFQFAIYLMILIYLRNKTSISSSLRLRLYNRIQTTRKR